MLDQTLFSRASQAVSDIILPFFNPDVMLKGFSPERAQSLTGTVSPIIWEVTQSLPDIERLILDSAMQMFTGADTPRWGLHMFAMSTDRNQQLEQAMAYKYNARVSASEYIDVDEYILRFKKLKQKVEEKIESLASDKNYTFKVFRAFRGLIFQVKTEEDFTYYLANQTWSFCFACVEEGDFTRPSLQAWFITEGAQHIEACIGILNYAVTQLDISMAFKMIAIIYCGFKIQDATILGPFTIWGHAGSSLASSALLVGRKHKEVSVSMPVPTSKQLPAMGYRTTSDFNKNQDENSEISKKRKRLNSSELDIVDDAINNPKNPKSDLRQSGTPASDEKKTFCELDEDAQWEKVRRRLEHKPSSQYHHLNDEGKRRHIQKHILQMINGESLKAHPPSASLALRKVILPQSCAVSTSTLCQDTVPSTVTPMLSSGTGSQSGLSDKPPFTVSFSGTQSHRGSTADTSEVKETDKDNGYLSVAIKDHVIQGKDVLLGYWGSSPKADIKDKHAIYGVCQSNKAVRIKIAQHTRDWRPIKGLGSGFKVKYETCILEIHLKDLTRIEIEEYCRICVNHHNSVEEPTIGWAIEEARRTVARKAQAIGLSVAKFNEERCHYLECQRSNSASHRSRNGEASEDGPSIPSRGRRLRKRTQPQTASIDQTSDSEPNEESGEDTDFAYTSDFNPNKQSNQSNTKPVSSGSLRTESPMSRQDMPQKKTLVVRLPTPSLSRKTGLEDGIDYRKHTRNSLKGHFVSLNRDVIDINGTYHVQQFVLIPMGMPQPRLQDGHNDDGFKMALEGLFKGNLIGPERKVIELDFKEYIRFTVQMPLDDTA
ncbi:hypothetical protein V496_00979 [Pseudogymnoascus sp. VKM F-4515 (FW-2607)]|nr:hypothetical protein V496_00979 [Pseudogymnoascus sp. VKM F-4515 (FW-2607)]